MFPTCSPFLETRRLAVLVLVAVCGVAMPATGVSPAVAGVQAETATVATMLLLSVSHQRIPSPPLPPDCPGYITELRTYSDPGFPETLLNNTPPADLEPLNTVLSFISSYYSLPPMLSTIRLGTAIATGAVRDAESLAAYKNAVDHARALQLLTVLHQNFSDCFGLDPYRLTPAPYAVNWTFSPTAHPEYAFDLLLNGTSASMDLSAKAAAFAAAAGATTSSCVVVDDFNDFYNNNTCAVRVRFVGPDAVVLQTNALKFAQLLNAPILARLGILVFHAVLLRSPAPPPPPDGLGNGVLLLPLLVLVPLIIWASYLAVRHVQNQHTKRKKLDEELKEILRLPDD